MAYGAKYVGSISGNNQAVMREFQVKASTTVTKGDFVRLEAGYLDVAAAGETILGVANETVVQTASSTTKCDVIMANDAIFRVLNDNVGTTFAVTHPGTYFDITGTTGAQMVDTSSTTTAASLFCLEFSPDGDDTYGDFIVAETQQGLSQ